MASVELTGIGKLIIKSAYFPHDSAFNPPEEAPSLVDYPRKTKWECYSAGLQADLQGITMEIRDADALERVTDLFSSDITTAYEHNYSLPSEIKKARVAHWSNKKFEKLRKESRKSFRQAKKGNREELWNLSNSPREANRKVIGEAKSKNNWEYVGGWPTRFPVQLRLCGP